MPFLPDRPLPDDDLQAEMEAADDARYPDCPICGEPIDYCLGHGAFLSEQDAQPETGS